MEKIDGRKLTPKELSGLRKIVIKLRNKGMPNKEVAKIVGISATVCSTYYSLYKKEGNKVFKIRKEAKKQKADIWWCDETACISMPTNLKGYALKGSKNKPILNHPAKKFKINMISAITNTGKSMFALYDESINVDRFLDFLKKVIDSINSKKVFMILDNLRVHHAKLTKEWVKKHKEKIELFYLPAYSPDLNPDEYLNQHYKKNANKNNIPKNKDELKNNTQNYINKIQNDKEKIASFFQNESVKYAA